MRVDLPTTVHPAAEGETAPPLVMAHGLFGQGRNFASLARRLAATRRVVTVDMRNHGAARHVAEMDYPAMADDLAGVVEAEGGRAVVLGHSMGGKAAMVLALSRPDLLAGLIVADIAPVAYGHTHAGFVEAMQGVDLARVGRRSDADPMLRDAIPEAPLRAFLLQSLEVAGGEARWKLNLSAIAAAMPTLTGFPDDLPETAYEGPALFLRGGASDYVPPSAEPRIRALFPAAEIETMAGAGHWLHAEKPDAFVATVAGWLDRH